MQLFLSMSIFIYIQCVHGPILRLFIASMRGMGVELSASCIVGREGEAIIVMDCAIASPYVGKVMYYYHYYFYC